MIGKRSPRFVSPAFLDSNPQTLLWLDQLGRSVCVLSQPTVSSLLLLTENGQSRVAEIDCSFAIKTPHEWQQ